MADNNSQTISTKKLVNGVLSSIEREREREIISRRSGLFERKETLEQIGELLGITRERVRQLEKSVMTKLQLAGKSHALNGIDNFGAQVLSILEDSGKVMRVSHLSNKLVEGSDRNEQSRVAFLCDLCPDLIVIGDDDNYFASVADNKNFSEKSLKQAATKVVETITKLGVPKSITAIAKQAEMDDLKQAEALASISKHLATLNGQWGLIKWPLVNPKNIRDKIYVILK
ncbi:MAG: sigma factor-like helix-turn-helix DNA-binding protein, partial [Candidatus Saccharimonadales bacterium]